MTGKYTPGPWSVYDCHGDKLDACRFENGAFQVMSVDCDHHAVADCSCNHSCRMEDECEANARLIAAAPDLLEACMEAVEALNGHPNTMGTEELLLSAIAKAEGRE